MLLINLDHHKKCPPCQSILRPATLVSSSILLHSARIYVNSSLALLIFFFFYNLFTPKFANSQAAEAIALALSGIIALVNFVGLSCGTVLFLMQ